MRRVLIGFVVAYQRLISPLLPPACRFAPSCSDYAVEALAVHGVLRGLALAAWRLLRCHPLCRGGFDPVPPAGESVLPWRLKPTGPLHGSE